MAHALLANFTMTWQRKFRTCSSAHLLKLAVFIGGNKSSREQKFQGAKAPGSESSRERTFQGAKVPHLELSLPRANSLGSEKSIVSIQHEVAAPQQSPIGINKLSLDELLQFVS